MDSPSGESPTGAGSPSPSAAALGGEHVRQLHERQQCRAERGGRHARALGEGWESPVS